MTAYRQRLDAGVYKQGAAPVSAPLPQLEHETSGAFVCADCDRTFDSEHGLKIHRTKTHGAINGDEA